MWFNRKRGRVGHVFQGRFSSTLIDGEGAWALGASVYIHLNPVRTQRHGLGKAKNRAEGRGSVAIDRKTVLRRLKTLRHFRWSSYRAYAGYGPVPAWLTTGAILERGGGRAEYRRYVQQHVTRGDEPEGYEDLGGKVALGSREFLEKAKGWVRGLSKEQPGRTQVTKRATVAMVVSLVEGKRGEKWGEFADRHGDWGRELVLYLARKRTGLTLHAIGEALGIREYKTVGRAVQRFESSLAQERARRRMVKECLDELSQVET